MENTNSRSKINNLKLVDIFELIGNMLSDTDIIYFCNDEKIVNEYLELYDYKQSDRKEIQEFLIENEDKIDKEKLVFAIYLSYKINLEVINKKIDVLSSNLPENTKELYRFIKQKELQSKYMKKAESLLRDTDVYILKVKSEDNRLYSNLYSSKEMVQNRKKSETRNLERIKQIDEDLSSNGDGSTYLLQMIVLTDLQCILPDKQSGIQLRDCLLNNAVYNKGEYDARQLKDIRVRDSDKYQDIILKHCNILRMNISLQSLLSSMKWSPCAGALIPPTRAVRESIILKISKTSPPPTSPRRSPRNMW